MKPFSLYPHASVLLIAVAILFFMGFAVQEEDEALFDVARFLVVTFIEDREPGDPAEKFSAETERVYCFLEARNIQRNTKVTFNWFISDSLTARVEVELREGPRWRTWSSKTIEGQAGEWRVELHDENEDLVDSITFNVQ